MKMVARWRLSWGSFLRASRFKQQNRPLTRIPTDLMLDYGRLIPSLVLPAKQLKLMPVLPLKQSPWRQVQAAFLTIPMVSAL